LEDAERVGAAQHLVDRAITHQCQLRPIPNSITPIGTPLPTSRPIMARVSSSWSSSQNGTIALFVGRNTLREGQIPARAGPVLDILNPHID